MLFSSALLLPLAVAVAGAAVTSGSSKTTVSTKSATTKSSMPTVTLDYSKIVAAAGNQSLGYYKYQNIRYAAVPTGTRRWAQPQWPPTESIVNNGTLAAEDVDCSSEEDCLYLDVWAPANSSGKKLPVMVWTYGGGFTGGSKSQNTPEGLFNLTKDFVFVAYNYRLGMTGLANGPTYEHQGGIANTALWDVTHAFQWTKKYISKFGGDPSNVAAVGFSAGGSQVMFQMTRFAGQAEQLFQRAYIMSPGYVPGAGHQHAEAFWQNVSTTVGCPGGKLDCMRGIAFDTLNTAATTVQDDYTYQFQPRVDGYFVPDTYEASLYKGHSNFNGPCVITHEQHENNGVATSGVNTTADVATYLRIFFPAISDSAVQEILDLYPESDYSSPGLRFADMRQSFDLTGKNFALTEALKNQTWNGLVALGSATHGTDQSYYWYSTYTLSSSTSSSSTGSVSSNSSTAAGPGTGTASVSATNSSTSSAASSTSSSSSGGPGGATGGAGGPGGSSTSVNSTIAIAMQKYLMSFVLTGNPNKMWTNETLYWPKYGNASTSGSTGGNQIVFNSTFYITPDDLANNRTTFWNKALWY